MADKQRSTDYELGYAAGFEAGRKTRSARWTDRDLSLLSTWEGTDAALSAKIGRSRLAIRLKRHKIKREDER